MKDEIKILRKCQKIAWEAQFPGYPLQVTAIIDLSDESAWIDYCGRKTTLNAFMNYLNQIVAYNALDSDFVRKGNFIQNSFMEEPTEIIDGDNDCFYIDSYEVVKLYFAVNSAIRHNKGTNAIIFAACDLNAGYVDVRVFNELSKIQTYYNEYWKQEDDE